MIYNSIPFIGVLCMFSIIHRKEGFYNTEWSYLIDFAMDELSVRVEKQFIP